MADGQHSSHRTADSHSSLEKELQEITRNCRSIQTKSGSLTRYILNKTNVMNLERLQRDRFGEEDKSKPHKTILMVGETGMGKSTLINVMANHMLGVKWENRIWFEITETQEQQTGSQTNKVTVYDVFAEKSPFSLTVIDTPGYGSTGGEEDDLKVTESLHELFRSKDGVKEIDLVCLVVSAATARLTDRQLYVFDSILSLFGKDVEGNIVVLSTRAPKKPTTALRAIKASKFRCSKTENGEPVCFWFDNSHCEDFYEENNEEEEEYKKTAWGKNEKNMKNFFSLLNDSKTVSLKMTESVLRTHKQLTAAISNLKERVTLVELQKQELEQTKAAVQEYEKEKKDMNNFECEVDEVYKEKVPIESKFWHLSKEATCCRLCEENCHYPGCWWVRDLSWCSVMTEGKCTVCTGKCDHTQHVKEGRIYVLKTRKVKKTTEDLNRKYEEKYGEKMSLISRLENEIKGEESKKNSLLDKCYQCVVMLDELALKSFSASVLQNLEFIIEKMKEARKTEKADELDNLKKKFVETEPADFLNHPQTIYHLII